MDVQQIIELVNSMQLKYGLLIPGDIITSEMTDSLTTDLQTLKFALEELEESEEG